MRAELWTAGVFPARYDMVTGQYEEEMCVAAAIFALLGVLIGALSAFGVELVRARVENRRLRQDALRLACADFAATVSHMWNMALALKSKPADKKLAGTFHETFWEARMHYERLRLTTASGGVQKEARYVLRYAYGLLREREGLPRRDDEMEKGPFMMLQHSLLKLVGEVRREIGVPHSGDVFREPDEWMERDL
jgi:hypothetical protein